MGRGPKQTYLQRGHTHETYEKMLNVINREIHIKTTMRFYLTPVRMAIINKPTNKCWQECGERGTLVHY